MFKGGSLAYRFSQEEVVVLGLDSEVLEYRVGPEALHEILSPVNTLRTTMHRSNRTQLSI
jgi:hypothetical protein